MESIIKIVESFRLIGELYSVNDESYLQLIQNLNLKRLFGGNRNFWKPILDPMKDEDLVNIFKGFVLQGKKINLHYGSVDSAIWIYGLIRERGLDLNYEIADWGLRNSENPYVPFGTAYSGKRTYKDYLEYQSLKFERQTKKAKEYEQLQQRVKGRRLKRKKAIQNLRRLSFEERGRIIEELLKKYNNAVIIEKLDLIARDNEYPPEYYPKQWVQLSNEEISLIPSELALNLIDKLYTNSKGDWRRFRDALIEIYE